MSARAIRLGGACGVLYAALFVTTIFLVSPDAPTSSTTGPEIVRFFAQRRDDMTADLVISGFIGLAFLGFLAVLRAVVSRAGASDGAGAGAVAVAVAYLVGAGGIVYVALAYAGSVGYDVYAATLNEFDAFHGASPDTGFLLWNAGNWFVNYSAVGGGVAVGAASALALRTHAFPAWLAWLGLVVGAAAILNFATVYGFEAILVWTLLASIVMLVAPRRMAAPAPA